MDLPEPVSGPQLIGGATSPEIRYTRNYHHKGLNRLGWNGGGINPDCLKGEMKDRQRWDIFNRTSSGLY